MFDRNRLPELKTGGLLASLALTACILSAASQSPYVTERLHNALVGAERSLYDGDVSNGDPADEGQGLGDAGAHALTHSQPIEPITAERREAERDQRDEDDLRAQERMAVAAENIVILTLFQTIIGLLGTGAVIGALIWTIKGTKTAMAQAAAAVESNKLIRAAHVAEMRPWVTLDVRPAKLFYNVNGLNLTVIYTAKIIGRSPATNVWIDSRLHAPAIAVEFGFAPSAIQANTIGEAKRRPVVSWGSLLFPDQIMIQEYSMGIGSTDLERLTQKVQFIMPYLIAVVDYGSLLDASRHFTASTFDVQRSDRPRPESAAKNRSPTGIFVDEGDIEGSDLVLRHSPIAPAYAD